jgi:hypothetical protein
LALVFFSNWAQAIMNSQQPVTPPQRIRPSGQGQREAKWQALEQLEMAKRDPATLHAELQLQEKIGMGLEDKWNERWLGFLEM